MASNIDEIVSELSALLQQGMANAADAARAAPERFSELIAQALHQAEHGADQVADLPNDILEKLRHAKDHPDWLSLMIFCALKLKEVVGDSLKVGAHDPGEGWSKALALRLIEPLPPGGETELRLSIALGGEGVNGFIVAGKNESHFQKQGTIELVASATGDIEWRFPFDGPVARKGGQGRLQASVRLAKSILPSEGSDIGLSIGAPRISGEIKAEPGGGLDWSLAVEFCDSGAGNRGIEATIDLKNFLGALADVVHFERISESYSPLLKLASREPPKFDLRHEGL